jgi:hypothetical protein
VPKQQTRRWHGSHVPIVDPDQIYGVGKAAL